MSSPSQVSIFPATSASASRLAELLQQQHSNVRVRLAARSPQKLTPQANATVAQTPLDIADLASFKDALEGSDAAYIMNPPFYGEKDPFALSQTFIDNVIEAANASTTLKKIVYLSSIGAEKTSGTGPIRNVHIAENALLAKLRDGIEIITLRPPFFLSNLKAVLPLAINPPHILPSMLLPFEKAYSTTDAKTIAATALKYLFATSLSSSNAAKKGNLTAVQIVTPRKTIPELAQIVSEITGSQVNPVPIPEDQWFETFKKAGMFDEQAGWFVDMSKGTVSDYITYLDKEASEEESKRGVTVVTEHADVDHKAALKALIDQVKSV